MLTICTRCRTPYDRRQAAPRALAAMCTACATGAQPEQASHLAPVTRLEAELTVLPRTFLPVAS
jgi:hypothetical protein